MEKGKERDIPRGSSLDYCANYRCITAVGGKFGEGEEGEGGEE